MQIEHFFSPNSGEDQKKKKIFGKNRTLFSPNLRSAVHPFKLLGGGDADVDHSQTIGGDISPHSPRVSAPLCQRG